MSLNGKIPIMIHQRLDFFLLAMDQLVNNASKWNIMFGGKNRIPITIRLIIGRGWVRDQLIVKISNLGLLIPGLVVSLHFINYEKFINRFNTRFRSCDNY